MAVGLAAAGYNIVWANDFDKNACKAYAANIGPHIIHGDITAIDPDTIPDADVIAGGPPCQDYSVAGPGAGETGERGRLVWTYLNVIERKQPKAFVFENVKGLITKKHRQTFDALLQRFDEIGYNVSWRLINAWDYGVAQKRERVFIVGIRKDLGFTFTFPEPDPSGYRTQVLRDVIGDLPEPGVKLSDKAVDYLTRDPRHLQKHRPPTFDEAVPTLPAVLHKGVPYGLFYPDNHVQTRATTVKPEQSLSNQRGYVAEWDKPGRTVNVCRLDHAEIHPGPLTNHRCLDNVNPSYNHRRAQEVYPFELPSQTITAHSRNEGIHPVKVPKPRRFTVRECLRIQSVPDTYVLPDDISLSAQYRIVGNGVASRVAYVIGNALASQLNEKGAR